MAKTNGKSSYFDKLKDPRWQKLRLQMLNEAGFACEECGAEDNTLHVHHTYYEYGKDPWDYPQSSLKVYCEDCHDNAHKLKKWLQRLLCMRSISEQASLINILQITWNEYFDSDEILQCMVAILYALQHDDTSRVLTEFQNICDTHKTSTMHPRISEPLESK